MSKVQQESKRARGVVLRCVPAGTPVYATAPAGRDRFRWAVWACKEQVRGPDLGWFERMLQRVEPISRGFASTDEEATRAALEVAPAAIRIARDHASAGALAWIEERAEMYALAPKVAELVADDDELRRVVALALEMEPDRAYQRLRDAYKARTGAGYYFDWQGYICRYAIHLLVSAGTIAPSRRARVAPSRECLAAVEAETAPIRAAVAAAVEELGAIRSRPVSDAWREPGANLRALECLAVLAHCLPLTDPRRAECIALACDALAGASQRRGCRWLMGAA